MSVCLRVVLFSLYCFFVFLINQIYISFILIFSEHLYLLCHKLAITSGSYAICWLCSITVMTSAAMMIVTKISVTIMSVLASLTVYGGILLIPYFISVPKANGVLVILLYLTENGGISKGPFTSILRTLW